MKAELRQFDDYLVDALKSRRAMKAYLDAAFEAYEEDGDEEALLLALKDVAKAQGGLGKLADKTHLSRQSLYKSLSKNGNPRLRTLHLILRSLGFKLRVSTA